MVGGGRSKHRRHTNKSKQIHQKIPGIYIQFAVLLQWPCLLTNVVFRGVFSVFRYLSLLSIFVLHVSVSAQDIILYSIFPVS